MLGSIRLGSVFGIQVRMHWTFAVLVGGLVWLAAIRGQDPFLMLLAITVLFALVFLHELGHSLMARRFGIRVLDITFWPLGGMARMNEIPENSRVEGLIAVAGPAVNLALAFLTVPVFVWSELAAEGGAATPFVHGLQQVSMVFLYVNLMLGLFNLVPAFPMDGGRLLRAWLGRRGDWVAATRSAVRVGRVFAVLMIAVGLFQGANLLPLVGLFVWFSGSRELAVVRARHAGWPGTPFGPPPQAPAEEVAPDPSGARRPRVPRPAFSPSWGAPEGRPARALSAAELESLEHYPGPLRRPSPD